MKFFHAHFSPFTGIFLIFFTDTKISFTGGISRKFSRELFFFTDTFSDFFHGWLYFFHGEKNTDCREMCSDHDVIGTFE